MATWKNLDTLETFKALSEVKRVKLAEAMSGAEEVQCTDGRGIFL